MLATVKASGDLQSGGLTVSNQKCAGATARRWSALFPWPTAMSQSAGFMPRRSGVR